MISLHAHFVTMMMMVVIMTSLPTEVVTIDHHDDNLLKDSGLWLHNTITPLFTADIYTAHLSHCSLHRGCTINNNLESIEITSLVLC